MIRIILIKWTNEGKRREDKDVIYIDVNVNNKTRRVLSLSEFH